MVFESGFNVVELYPDSFPSLVRSCSSGEDSEGSVPVDAILEISLPDIDYDIAQGQLERFIQLYVMSLRYMTCDNRWQVGMNAEYDIAKLQFSCHNGTLDVVYIIIKFIYRLLLSRYYCLWLRIVEFGPSLDLRHSGVESHFPTFSRS